MKEELINNKLANISIDRYESECKKMNIKIQLKMFKRLQNRANIENMILSPQKHILSVLIYCNCTDYQNKWSSTFRRIPNNETNYHLIKRHSHFYRLSKSLRELVEYFGESLLDNADEKFYHGVSKILYFTETVTQFNCPLSTSTEPAVAMAFSNGIGVLLELKYSFSRNPLHAKYFNCVLFSDFPWEKEKLLIGGVPIMTITNIRNVSNGEEYKDYINALNIINSIMRGTHGYYFDNINYVINDISIALCFNLLKEKLKIYKKTKKQIDTNVLNNVIMKYE
eukprot:511603_1